MEREREHSHNMLSHSNNDCAEVLKEKERMKIIAVGECVE
jgi:hypothetical protein